MSRGSFFIILIRGIVRGAGHSKWDKYSTFKLQLFQNESIHSQTSAFGLSGNEVLLVDRLLCFRMRIGVNYVANMVRN